MDLINILEDKMELVFFMRKVIIMIEVEKILIY